MGGRCIETRRSWWSAHPIIPVSNLVIIFVNSFTKRDGNWVKYNMIWDRKLLEFSLLGFLHKAQLETSMSMPIPTRGLTGPAVQYFAVRL
jgi:hypothetical protein